ncbi:MAG: putative Uncharacterized HTH-type transcriptional regulator ynfL [Actinomycetia bacterium]|nr:putative Uncharacterized HTH-type transcriptional regulator ynfL [Actinomycetes bacterium]
MCGSTARVSAAGPKKFVWLPADLTGLHAEVVHTEPRVVGLPSGHPLAGRGGITVMEVNDVEEMLEQVAEGAAICFAPSSMAQYYARPDLSWVPLTDVDPLQVALAWPDNVDTPLVQGFAHVVRELASDQ